MNESKHTPRVRPGPGRADDEAIGRLLRLAGPRPRAPRERSERVKAAVHAHWQEQLQSQQPADDHAEAKPRPSRKRWPSRMSWQWQSGLVLAAAASLLIGFGLVMARWQQAPPAPVRIAGVETLTGQVELISAGGTLRQLTPTEPVVTGTTVVTGSDGRVGLRLGNGPSLRLDHQTRLRMVSATVVALDRGAVYVDSGAEPGTSITVETRLGVAHDIGTQFELRIDDEKLQVRVREGTVRLDREQGVHDAEAGTELLVRVDGTMVCRTIPRYGELWDWVLEIAPGLTLEGVSLATFLDWVGRETGWQVRPADEQAAQAIISSKLTVYGSLAGLSPAQAPAAVLPTCNLDYTLSRGTLIIRTMGGDRPKE